MMKYFFKAVLKYIVKFFVGIWDFIFFFFGMPYEEQACKLKLDEYEDIIGGPENEQTEHQFYRANKVSNESEEVK